MDRMRSGERGVMGTTPIREGHKPITDPIDFKLSIKREQVGTVTSDYGDVEILVERRFTATRKFLRARGPSTIVAGGK
jgi:hypothetical protein